METNNTFIDQTLQLFDKAITDLDLAEDTRIHDFSISLDGHGLPGRVFSFIGNDSVNRNIHIYIYDEKKDLEVTVDVNAWKDNANTRRFMHKTIQNLPILSKDEDVKNSVERAFNEVLNIIETNLHP